MRLVARRRYTRLSDAALLEQSAEGDGDAFAMFYRRHLDPVLAYLRQRTPNPEVAADLTAETFVSALGALRSKDATRPTNGLAWLIAIAHNKLVDSVRRGVVEDAARRSMRLAPLTLTDGDLERVEEVASRTDVALVLARELPSDQRAALEARVFADLPYSEIADRLGCSQSVARQRVSRALKSLKAGLENQ